MKQRLLLFKQLMNKKVDSNRTSYTNHKTPDPDWMQPLCKTSTTVAANQSCTSHQRCLPPKHGMSRNKGNHCDSIGAGS